MWCNIKVEVRNREDKQKRGGREGRNEETYGTEGAHAIKAHIKICETIRGLRGEVFERKEGLFGANTS